MARSIKIKNREKRRCNYKSIGVEYEKEKYKCQKKGKSHK